MTTAADDTKLPMTDELSQTTTMSTATMQERVVVERLAYTPGQAQVEKKRRRQDKVLNALWANLGRVR